MTKKTEQQKILEAIERMLAGETVEMADGKEPSQLIALARELLENKPQPNAGFSERLGRHLDRLESERAVSSAEVARKRGQRRWFPTWITAPRAGVALAVLVIGLGMIGLTSALLRGERPGGAPEAGLVVERDSAATDADALYDEKSTGLAAPEGSRESAVGAPGAGSASPGSLTAGDTSAQLPSTGRVIQSADYEIKVPRGDFQDRFNQISSLAGKYGGYVVSANTRKRSEDDPLSGTITIRVANIGDNFALVQSDLDQLGNVVSKNVAGQDVTEEYVDLESRLRNAEAQEAQLLALMQKATTIEEILTIQSRLADIQSQIEQIKGRIKYLESRTDFATVTVDLREEDADGDFPGSTEDETNWGFIGSLKYAGWLAVQTVNFVIIALGVIVPAIIILTAIALVVYRLAQKWQRNRGK